MASGGAGETAAGNLRRARISDVFCWVMRSWENISAQRKYGIGSDCFGYLERMCQTTLSKADIVMNNLVGLLYVVKQ